MIEIAAEAERGRGNPSADFLCEEAWRSGSSVDNLSGDRRVRSSGAPVSGDGEGAQEIVQQTWHARQAAAEDRERERRTYRGRAVAMLRRYMRYSIETGRLPSLLGREFFRAKVTSYTVVTFEDRVIFVHDMERCLERLDEFSRQLIARHILQEHDRWATAKLLHCNEKTVRRYTPVVLDMLIEILLEVGLMERLGSTRENPCQGGGDDSIAASDWEDGK